MDVDVDVHATYCAPHRANVVCVNHCADTGDVTDLPALAARIGAVDFTSQPVAPLTTAYATATINGQLVQLYAFASNDMRDAFVTSVVGFGITAADFIVGDQYLIAPHDATQLPAMRQRNGPAP